MQYISAKEFHNKKTQARVIDVRTKREHEMLDHFNFGENIEMSELLSNLDKYCPDKNQFIVIHCNAGNRSGETTDIMNQKGYKNTYTLQGGIYDYHHHYPKDK